MLGGEAFRTLSPFQQCFVQQLQQKLQKLIPEIIINFQKSVETHANELMAQVYWNMSVDDFISEITKLRDSNLQNNQDIYCCILISLVEESKFFKDFPEKELFITA